MCAAGNRSSDLALKGVWSQDCSKVTLDPACTEMGRGRHGSERNPFVGHTHTHTHIHTRTHTHAHTHTHTHTPTLTLTLVTSLNPKSSTPNPQPQSLNPQSQT